MTAKTVAVIIIILYNVRICQSKRYYDNYTLFLITPTRNDQMKFLKNLEVNKYIDVIFWKRPNLLRQEVHCIVSPEQKSLFLERTRHFDLKAIEKLNDVQRAFDSQHIKKYIRSEIFSYSWEYYHSLEDIYQWLKDMSMQYPNITDLISIGKSAEGRQIYAFSVKHTHQAKHKVIVEGGIHGHEWIAVEFVTYLVNILLKRQKYIHRGLHELAKQYQWFLIPIVNPDGYDYTQREDRIWRKNRRVINPTGLINVTGVDLNRNFDYNWGRFDSSKNPSADNYCGPRPFSEPETQALRNFIHQQKINLKFYFSVHAYGQQLIIPYSDRINHIDNFRVMENFAKQAVVSMYKVNRQKYGTGSNYDTMGQLISGNSESWVKRTVGIRYVLTFLLRDTGAYGYALPSSQIIETCEETITGLTKLMTAKPKMVKLDLYADNRAQALKGAIAPLCYFVLFILFYF